MMKQKDTCTYKKLVLPSSKKSIYWKHFGFPTTENSTIINKTKVICKLCNSQYAFSGNTSNLRTHLLNMHLKEYNELISNSPCEQLITKAQKTTSTPKYTNNADGIVQIDDDIQFVMDPNITPDDNAMDQPVIDKNAVAEFIVMNLQLPEIVEDHGFQRLISFCSYYNIPGKKRLEDNIMPNMHKICRESVAATLSCIKIDKITAVVANSSRAELITATNCGLTLVPCLHHTLQICAQACFDHPDVAQILSICRLVIRTIGNIVTINRAAILSQEQLSLKNVMLLDYPGVWISTHNMLEQMVLYRSIITTVLEQMAGIN